MIPPGWVPPQPQATQEYQYWYRFFMSQGIVHPPPPMPAYHALPLAHMHSTLNKAKLFGTDEEEK
jgi:hypothetical protein